MSSWKTGDSARLGEFLTPGCVEFWHSRDTFSDSTTGGTWTYSKKARVPSLSFNFGTLAFCNSPTQVRAGPGRPLFAWPAAVP
jgi:hypothetical protein